MPGIWKFFAKINKNLIIAIPVMMILGFVYGVYFPTAGFKNAIIPFTFLMVYPMMVNLKIKKVFEGGDLKAQFLTQIINFGIIPFAAYWTGLYFFPNSPYMALGLLLAGLVPTSGMTISWTGFAKGNMEAAVKMTVIGLTLGSLATPLYVRYLMGAEIEVNLYAVFKQIVIIVFIPMGLGFLTQQGLVRRYGQKEFQSRFAPRFPGLSTLGVLGIVFIAMALKAKAIYQSPQMLLTILIPLALIYLFNYILSTLTGKLLLPRGDAIALVYGSVMRNLSIALAIAINAFGKEGSSAALVIAVAYIIQVQSAAWYVKFTDIVFGAPGQKPREPEAPAKKAEEAPGETDLLPYDFKKILYATDLSGTARHAIRYACNLGLRYNAHVTVLHVVPDALEELSAQAGVDISRRFSKDRWSDFNETEILEARDALVERIVSTYPEAVKDRPDCPLSTRDIEVKVGDPVEEILHLADKGGYDLIVMGTRGHGEFESAFAGSVATGVVHRSTIPVMVVRLPFQRT